MRSSPALSIGARLFAGGATTVRGFRQNELGPLLYVARFADTVRVNDTLYLRTVNDTTPDRAVPSGGNSVIVANAEYRMRSPFLPEVLQWTVFTDAGAVWNRGVKVLSLRANLFRVTPGVGVRVYTPVGPLRVDVGYNPYSQVAGPAYYSPPFKEGQTNAPLYCVSPANTLPVTIDAAGNFVQENGPCPLTFEPPRRSGFLRRLTPTFSIQQAF